MPNSQDVLLIDRERILWYAHDEGFVDTCRYRISGDSIWIERGAHSRSEGTEAFHIAFDGSGKFRLQSSSIREFKHWYERIDP